MGGEGAKRWKFKGRNGIPLQGSLPKASSSSDMSCQRRVPHPPSWSPRQVLRTSRQLQRGHPDNYRQPAAAKELRESEVGTAKAPQGHHWARRTDCFSLCMTFREIASLSFLIC